VTISISAAPDRFKSTRVPSESGSWNDLAVSCFNRNKRIHEKNERERGREGESISECVFVGERRRKVPLLSLIWKERERERETHLF